MSTGAARMRLLRERRSQHRIKFHVDVNRDRLALALGEDGFLGEWNDSDDALVQQALQRMIETYISAVIGPPA